MKCFNVLALILASTLAIHIPQKYAHYKPGYIRIPEWEKIASGERKLMQKEPTMNFKPREDVLTTVKCGIPGNKIDNLDNDLNVTEARPHQFPWLVGLFFGDYYFCVGTIISSKYILTAAYCADGVSHHEVVIGAHELMDPDNKIINSYNSIVHPEYESYSLSNDIAILELEKDLDFDTEPNVGAICLASSGDFTGQMSLVSGWGPSEETGKRVVVYVDDLPILSKSECSWGDLNEGIICIETEVCINPDSGGGGPLSIPGAQFEQIGIASFGTSLGCFSGHPTIFTEVSKYHSWISSVTGIKFDGANKTF